jgi:hypothetical protein
MEKPTWNPVLLKLAMYGPLDNFVTVTGSTLQEFRNYTKLSYFIGYVAINTSE